MKLETDFHMSYGGFSATYGQSGSDIDDTA